MYARDNNFASVSDTANSARGVCICARVAFAMHASTSVWAQEHVRLGKGPRGACVCVCVCLCISARLCPSLCLRLCESVSVNLSVSL